MQELNGLEVTTVDPRAQRLVERELRALLKSQQTLTSIYPIAGSLILPDNSSSILTSHDRYPW
jgi:hypothetical protein